MKNLLLLIFTIFIFACNTNIDKNKIKAEIEETEKQFEIMCGEKSIADAFTFFADESAVIKRGNDSLISGKKNIFKYYTKDFYKNEKVKWKPDFIEVSQSGDLAYSYGKYIWKNSINDTIVEYKGIYTTIWKRQHDNSWKYVWD